VTPAAAQHAVRFAPSKVEGLPDVDEVAVFPDRLEVRSAGAWQVFPFKDMPEGPSAPPVLFGLGGARPRVADLLYVREPYSDSYFRFYTDPPLTVYMPADGPALSPHSVFWRVQQVLKRGGYYADDADYDQQLFEAEQRKRPAWARFTGRFLFRLAFVNIMVMFGTMLYLGGDALQGWEQDGHYYLGWKSRGKPLKRWEVSRDVWRFSYVTQVAGWSAPVIGFSGYVLAYGLHPPRHVRGRRAVRN
jgi:hypothetical protein